eukprot:GHVS01082883.1.p1 GENE.GHVS01082883.1~~GHVS01082883.1.p1  ORF type:complete len:226 (-),score=13.31 GHVS01082883.1:120-797(-)
MTVSSVEELKKMSGADICYKSGGFKELETLYNAGTKEQGSINDKFVMENKSWDLVDSASIVSFWWTCVKYTFGTDVMYDNYPTYDRKSVGEDKYCARMDSHITCGEYKCMIVKPVNSMETVLKDHFAGITHAFPTGVRIGGQTPPEVACVLAGMTEVTAMLKTTFLSIAGERSAAAKTFLDKGNMREIARAKNVAGYNPSLSPTVARVATPAVNQPQKGNVENMP